MSEQNILNPTAVSTLNPDYSIPIDDPDIAAMWQARSGRPYIRNTQVRGQVFQLHWEKADFTTYRALRQWHRQYRNEVFSFQDIEDSRYYTGRFAEGSFKHERVINNQVTVQAVFVEVPGMPMFQYPGNWGVDSVFLEERDGFGSDLVKLTGSWTFETLGSPLCHGDSNYNSSTTNDAAEWAYFGYGFRVWALKWSGGGIAEVSLDGTVLGTYDTFNATNVNAAPLWTQQNVGLGQHRVKLRATGTKNASSSGFNVRADALEVMR